MKNGFMNRLGAIHNVTLVDTFWPLAIAVDPSTLTMQERLTKHPLFEH